jgi:hypothetical protein
MRAGIVLSRQAMRVAVLRRIGRRVEWTATIDVADGEPPEAGLRAALDDLPPSVRSVSVALEADLCQVKVLSDIPAMRSGRLREALDLNATTWFLRTAPRLSATGSRRDASSPVVAAATSKELIDGIRATVGASGRVLASVVPLASCLAASIGTGALRREIGKCVETLEISHGWIAHRRYLPARFASDLPVDNDSPVAGAQRMGTIDPAVAAVRTPGPVRFGTTESVRAWRNEVGALALGALLWIAAAAVGFSQLFMARSQAMDRLSTLAPQLEVVKGRQEELARTQGALEALRIIMSGKASDLLLLERLTTALPPNVFLTGLTRERSGQVRVEGVIRGDGNPIELVQRAPGVRAARVVGALTRDDVLGEGGVRFTVTFDWAPGDVVDPA